MKVVRATEMGMCFGVRDALQAAANVPHPEQVTIHGELVHNPLVNERLSRDGFHQSPESDRCCTVPTPLVLITAHGVSNRERERLARAGKEVIDTTCPLVRRVHEAALELEAEGRHIVLIGKAGHVEVQGIVDDLTSYDVVAGPADVRHYDSLRLGIICQTTMPPDVVVETCTYVQLYNPLSHIRFVDTVCQPTRLRQQAMQELLQSVSVVVVVGGHNSNNTKRLVRLCEAEGKRAHHVENAQQLRPDWFHGVATVGLTAGTSTLDETIDEVEQALQRMPCALV